MGSFPHELPGYRHISDDATRAIYESLWGVTLDPEPGLRIPNMLDAAVDGSFKGIYIQGEDILQSDPNTHHVAAGLEAMECVVVHDLFLNETANYAHVFLPGSTFLEKDGTFTNAERRINRVRKVMAPKSGLADWEVDPEARAGDGAGLGLHASVRDHGRDRPDDARPSPASPSSCSTAKARCSGRATRRRRTARRSCISAASCAARASSSAPNMWRRTRRPGRASRCCSPPAASSASTMSARRRGAPTTSSGTRRTGWRSIRTTPRTAASTTATGCGCHSRAGETTLRALITDRVAPGVVYTTFHHPSTQANVITTDFSDWATNCPEYKVTAVQVSPSNGPTDWQDEYDEQARRSRRIRVGWKRRSRGERRRPELAMGNQRPAVTAISRLVHRRFGDAAGQPQVPEETPVALSYGGTTHAVMMASPADFEDFALGFPPDRRHHRRAGRDRGDRGRRSPATGIDIQIRLKDKANTRFEARRRRLAGPVGCGLCGIESIEEAMRAVTRCRCATACA